MREHQRDGSPKKHPDAAELGPEFPTRVPPMTVTEAKALALSMGLRLVEYEAGEDKFLVKEVSTDLWVTYVRPFAEIAEWLKRIEARGPMEHDGLKRNYESALGLIGQTADPPANPVLPSCGRSWTKEDGWTVWVQNDEDYWLSVTLSWKVGDRQMSVRASLPPTWREQRSSDYNERGILRPHDISVSL